MHIAVELSQPPAQETVAPVVERIAYQPGIDGLRALALLAIFVVHADMGLASGAFLAVSTFFTLSGFLITSLLVIEHRNRGRIALRAFWIRRARRLLPAAIVAIVTIGLATVVLGDATQVTNLRADTLSALGYVANWHFILSGTTYGARFGGESPLLHFWSLAIEEQFYVVFPLMGAAGLAWSRRWRPGLAVVLAGGVALSLAVGIIGSAGEADVDRLYFGTDVRGAELLVGGLVALWWVPRRGGMSAGAHRAIQVGGVGLVALMLALIATARSQDLIWYRGGLIAYALVTVGVVLAAVEERGPVRRLLASRPFVAIGVMSYGAYLFHWPVFVWLRSDTDLSGAGRLIVGTVISLALATVSYRMIEEPVRRGRGPGTRSLVAIGAGLVALALVVGVTAPDLSGADDGTTLDEAGDELGRHIATNLAAPGEAPNVGVFGDSTGLVMGLSLAKWDDTHADVRSVYGWAAVGCSIMSPVTIRTGGTTFDTPAHCDDWLQEWESAAIESDIDIAYVQFGPWEVYEMLAAGDYRVIGDPVLDDQIARRIATGLETLLEHVPVVAIGTSPHTDVGRVNGRSPTDPPPEADPERMDRLNEIILEVAERYPQVAVIDFAGFIEGRPDDAELRPDGVHLTDESATLVAGMLGPTLASLAPAPGQQIDDDVPLLPIAKRPATAPPPGSPGG